MTRDEGIEYLRNLPEHEPVFVLRAQDKFAPATVQVWSTMCSAQDAAATREKGARAAKLVMLMQKWQKNRKMKVPD